MSDDSTLTAGMRSPTTVARRSPRLSRENIAWAGSSVIFAILLFEAGARLAGWGQIMEFARSEAWGYLMKPTQTVWSYGFPVSINSMGFRGPEVTPGKAEGRRRVLFIGDSVTYGGGRIPEADLFVRVLETEANRQGLPVEAVNLSAPGWSPQNYRAYVERNGLLGADAVVVVLPEIDLIRPFGTMEAHGLSEHAPSLRSVSFGLKLADILRTRHAMRHDTQAIIAENVAALSFVRESSRGKAFLTVFVPNQGPPLPEEWWMPFEAASPEALDLRAEMRGRPLFFDGLHLNREGHRLVAARILERLRETLRRREGT
jgi:lysophospholipase L1-like esterase